MTEIKQMEERLCNIVIGCANKAKKYSLMSKITISDNYSKTYGQWKHINSNCWIEKCSNQSFGMIIFRPKYGVKILRSKYWSGNIQIKILE
jgi:predicted ATP-dependent endonuclease of OLD family